MLNKKLLLSVLILVITTPLGIVLPELFHAGSAWGEWNTTEISKLIGYIPQGVKTFTDIWHPLLPDYNFPFNNSNDLTLKSFAYMFSAITGALTCYLTTLLFLNKIKSPNNVLK